MDNAASHRDCDHRRAIADIQLREDVFYVHFGGLFADAQRDGDFLVSQTLGNQVDNFDFPRCQGRLTFRTASAAATSGGIGRFPVCTSRMTLTRSSASVSFNRYAAAPASSAR